MTRGPAAEDGAALRAVVPPAVRPVRSDQAWRDYGVSGAPFFSLVAGDRVLTEGVAWGVEQTAAHVGAALRGQASPEVARLRPSVRAPQTGPAPADRRP